LIPRVDLSGVTFPFLGDTADAPGSDYGVVVAQPSGKWMLSRSPGTLKDALANQKSAADYWARHGGGIAFVFKVPVAERSTPQPPFLIASGEHDGHWMFWNGSAWAFSAARPETKPEKQQLQTAYTDTMRGGVAAAMDTATPGPLADPKNRLMLIAAVGATVVVGAALATSSSGRKKKRS